MARLVLQKSPDTPIYNLIQRSREYLYLPDSEALVALMGAVAANLIQGPPVWLMLVGPPGCGKTELLNTLLKIPRVFPADSIESKGSLISGTSKKDRGKHATGGLLKMVEPHGALVTKDFTDILSMAPDQMKSIMATLREAYDGEYSRPIGSDGGGMVDFRGKMGYFAGVTPEIDIAHQVSASLGERWVFFRMDRREESSFAMAKMALNNSGACGWKEELAYSVMAMFQGLDLKFGRETEVRDFTDQEIIKLHSIGRLGAKCRSAVRRDAYSKEIMLPPEQESETRLITVLGQMLLGMEYIGVRESMRWKVLRKLALDSMPKLRRLVLELTRNGSTTGELSAAIGCSDAVIGRTLEDLGRHGLLVKEPTGEKRKLRHLWSEWLRQEWMKGWD